MKQYLFKNDQITTQGEGWNTTWNHGVAGPMPYWRAARLQAILGGEIVPYEPEVQEEQQMVPPEIVAEVKRTISKAKKRGK